MNRRVLAGLTIAALSLPVAAHAKIDLSCSLPTSTTAIAGRVENAQGQPQAGMTIELFPSNDPRAIPDRDVTGVDGRYLICVGTESGTTHDTYDVHVRDLNPAPLYGTVNQPYTTWSNLTGDADFTPASGLPLRYLTNLTITPAEISTASGPRTVEWLIRSKAPSNTTMRLRLDHLNTEVTVPFVGTENGGPSNGGWNRWTYSASFIMNATERLYWATARGYSGATLITETDRRPYTIDNTPPLFGEATTQQCGPGVHANPISPASPPGTTNPRPIVVHGVCDFHSHGARSGLDPFSLSGELCTDAGMTACTPIDPVLSTNSIVWWPNADLPLGDYFLRWRIADKAGNVVTNPIGYLLRVTDRGGQRPIMSGAQPGEVGSGNSLGIVVGSSLTSPNSYPYVGFRVTDADGQTDLVPGSLQVRVYSPDERSLVYQYDPTMPSDMYDPITKRGGANFDLSTGIFRASGFPLQGKPPGRYIATASISDHGGNGATMTWHWILLAAT